MNNIDRQYKELLEHILHFGVYKSDRTGTGTKSIFGWQIRHNMKEGFPLLTTKKVAFKTMVTELVWFLRGDTNIKFLVDNGCHIWNGDAIKNYEKHNGEIDWGPYVTKEEAFIEKIKSDKNFADKWGELGPIYGAQWRDWGGTNEVKLLNERDENGWLKFDTKHIKGVDQIENLISEIQNNPDSRRLMVSAWNIDALPKMVLPPCHYGFQVYTRELNLEERRKLVTAEMHAKIYTGGDPSTLSHSEIDQWSVPKRAISLMWNQRSVDTFLGLPFNIASYGLLLEMIADEVNMVPEDLIGNLGDCHLYLNHIEQAEEQITRTPYELPTIHVRDGIYSFMPDDVILQNYKSHPSIKAPLSN